MKPAEGIFSLSGEHRTRKPMQMLPRDRAIHFVGVFRHLFVSVLKFPIFTIDILPDILPDEASSWGLTRPLQSRERITSKH